MHKETIAGMLHTVNHYRVCLLLHKEKKYRDKLNLEELWRPDLSQTLMRPGTQTFTCACGVHCLRRDF